MSNETEVEVKRVSSKTARKAFWDWLFFAHSCYNYERLQGTGFLYAMCPVIDELYAKDDIDGRRKAMKRTGGDAEIRDNRERQMLLNEALSAHWSGVMGVAIVTGASSGMGREFARALATRSDVDEVWVVARRVDRLEALAAELSVPTRVIVADLSCDEGLAVIRAALDENNPQVDYLVNAAGLGKVGSYATVSATDAASMIDVNCRAAVLLTQMVIPYMSSPAIEPTPKTQSASIWNDVRHLGYRMGT